MAQEEDGVQVPVREGETEQEAVDRFTKEVQLRLDGKARTPLPDPYEEAAVQEFVRKSVKQVQDEIDGMKF